MITLTKSPFRNKYIWNHNMEVMEPMDISETIAIGVWKLNIRRDEIEAAIKLMIQLRYDIVLFSRGKILSYRRSEELP